MLGKIEEDIFMKQEKLEQEKQTIDSLKSKYDLKVKEVEEYRKVEKQMGTAIHGLMKSFQIKLKES